MTAAPMSFTLGKCKSCGAPVIWAETVSGSPMPVDEKPHPKGNVLVEASCDPRDPPFATVFGKKNHPPPGAELRLSHFVTCPDSAKHRRSR